MKPEEEETGTGRSAHSRTKFPCLYRTSARQLRLRIAFSRSVFLFSPAVFGGFATFTHTQSFFSEVRGGETRAHAEDVRVHVCVCVCVCVCVSVCARARARAFSPSSILRRLKVLEKRSSSSRSMFSSAACCWIARLWLNRLLLADVTWQRNDVIKLRVRHLGLCWSSRRSLRYSAGRDDAARIDLHRNGTHDASSVKQASRTKATPALVALQVVAAQ